MREAKIAPPDVPGKLMARNHKIDVDASLKDLVQSLVRRKTYDTSHSDDHKKKPSGKKLRVFDGLFFFFFFFLVTLVSGQPHSQLSP